MMQGFWGEIELFFDLNQEGVSLLEPTPTFLTS